MYRLEKIIDLGKEKDIANNNNNKGVSISYPLSVFRMAMVKGPFWKNNGKENIGIKILSEQLLQLRNTKNIRIDYLIVMGPILS
jgi:hypothetical protein